MSAVLFENELNNKKNQNNLLKSIQRHDFELNKSKNNSTKDYLNGKMSKHTVTHSSSRNSEKRSEFSKSPHKSFENEEHVPKDYMPFFNKQFHVHNHTEHKLPHLHTLGCERLITAFDKQREKRYYFTNELTPVRAYIKYDKELDNKKKSPSNNREIDLKNRLPGISAKFSKEITNCRFIKETLSYIPISTRFSKTNLEVEESDQSARSENNKNNLRRMSNISNNSRRMSNVSDNSRKLSILSDKINFNQKSFKK
jgi:hypothetical protein